MTMEISNLRITGVLEDGRVIELVQPRGTADIEVTQVRDEEYSLLRRKESIDSYKTVITVNPAGLSAPIEVRTRSGDDSDRRAQVIEAARNLVIEHGVRWNGAGYMDLHEAVNALDDEGGCLR